MRAWLQRERRLAALDAAIARGLSELDAGQGEEAQAVRRELLEGLHAKGSTST